MNDENSEFNFPIPLWISFIIGICYILLMISEEITVWTGVATVLLLILCPLWATFIQYWLYPKRKKWKKIEEEHAKEIGKMLKDEFNNVDIIFEKENFDLHIKKGDNDFQISNNFILALKHIKEYSSISANWDEIEAVFTETKKTLLELKKYILNKIDMEFKEKNKDELFKGIREIINTMISKPSIEKINHNQIEFEKHNDLYIKFEGIRITRLKSNNLDEKKIVTFFIDVLNDFRVQGEIKRLKTKIDNKFELDDFIEKINKHSLDIIKGKEKIKIIGSIRKMRNTTCDDCPQLFWLWNGNIF